MKFKIFIPYVIYFTVMLVLNTVIPMFAGDTRVQGIVIGMAGQIIMIPVLFVILQREKRLRDAFIFKDKSFKDNIVLPIIAGLLIGAVTTVGVAKLGMGTEEAFWQAQEVYRQNLLLTAVSSVIFAPVMEELLFREIIYRRMQSVYGVRAAVIISSLLFAVGHASLIQVIYGFLMGMLFALNYRERGTVISPMLMHAAANMVTIAVGVWLY